MSTPELFAGIDVGAGVAHGALVAGSSSHLEFRLEFVGARSGSPAAVARFCSSLSGKSARVAVDAPGGFSVGAHLDDLSLAPKFRAGRCSEVPVAGWPAVPWVTPFRGAALPGWMATGFEVWNRLFERGVSSVETFPAGVFHRLNGRRWPPPKSSAAGRARRLDLLSGLVALPESCVSWGHDQIDAVAAAVVAALGRPATHRCPRPDGSVMWVLEPLAGARG